MTRRIFPGAGLAAGLALVLAAQTGAAQVEIDPTEQNLIVRSHSGVPERVIQFLMQIGEPTPVELQAGENLRDRIETHCGHRRTVYEAGARRLNGDRLDDQLRARGSGSFLVPACAWFTLDSTVTISGDTKLDDLLEQETGFRGPRTRDAFLEANPTIRDSEDPGRLPAGAIVRLPYRSAWRTIRIRPESAFTVSTARARIAQLLRQADRDRLTTQTRLSPEGQIIPPVRGGTFDEALARCTSDVGDQLWPIDVQALLEALRRSTRVANERRWELHEPRVAVLDSGFARPPHHPFLWERLVTRPGAPGPVDYYGINGATRLDPPLSRAGVPDADHGTMVATLALGGTAFLQGDQESLSRIRLRLSSIVELRELGPERPLEATVREDAVWYAMQDAIRNEAYIINASFEFLLEPETIRSLVHSNSQILIIAAAGNLPQTVTDNPRWPASFGGEAGPLSRQVVTVGASQPDLGRAAFSSYGSNKVDILAPGCNVPTLGLDLSQRRANGTSYAAPIVAFAAGLIRQFGLTDGARIKERLVVSTDVRPDLYWHAWSSGTLNPAKAVELFHDYVEVEGQDEPVRGRLDWTSTGDWICSGEPDTPTLGRVLKAARMRRHGVSDEWLVIWRSKSGDLRRCRANLSNEFIDIVRDGQELPETIPLATIIDLISSSF